MSISIAYNAQAHLNVLFVQSDGQAAHAMHVIQAIVELELAQLAFLAIILTLHTVDRVLLFMINVSHVPFQLLVLHVQLDMTSRRIVESAQQVTTQILTQEF